LIKFAVSRCLQVFHQTDALKNRTLHPTVTLPGCVAEAKLEGVNVQLFAYLVDYRFHREGYLKRARGAIGRGWLVVTTSQPSTTPLGRP